MLPHPILFGYIPRHGFIWLPRILENTSTTNSEHLPLMFSITLTVMRTKALLLLTFALGKGMITCFFIFIEALDNPLKIPNNKTQQKHFAHAFDNGRKHGRMRENVIQW